MRLAFSQVIVDVLQVRCGGWRPADTHQELSICSMRASISCSSMNSPAVGLRDALLHGGAETGILLKKAQGSFTSRSASRTGMVGDLGKLHFLLGSEMDFHTPFSGRESSRLSQRACLCAFRRRR